jgi:hypothetical protein
LSHNLIVSFARTSNCNNVLKTLFCRWSGCSIKGNSFNTDTKMAISYVLSGIDFYDKLKIISKNENIFMFKNLKSEKA